MPALAKPTVASANRFDGSMTIEETPGPARNSACTGQLTRAGRHFGRLPYIIARWGIRDLKKLAEEPAGYKAPYCPSLVLNSTK